jgi:hypothetical protein
MRRVGACGGAARLAAVARLGGGCARCSRSEPCKPTLCLQGEPCGTGGRCRQHAVRCACGARRSAGPRWFLAASAGGLVRGLCN